MRIICKRLAELDESWFAPVGRAACFDSKFCGLGLVFKTTPYLKREEYDTRHPREYQKYETQP